MYIPTLVFVNWRRSTARSAANAVESMGAGATRAGAPWDAQPAAVSAMVATATRRRRRAERRTLLRRVDRRVETRIQRGVTADDGIPGDLGAVAATLRHDLDAFRGDRDGEDLPFVLQLALDALVEFRRHGSPGLVLACRTAREANRPGSVGQTEPLATPSLPARPRAGQRARLAPRSGGGGPRSGRTSHSG